MNYPKSLELEWKSRVQSVSTFKWLHLMKSTSLSQAMKEEGFWISRQNWWEQLHDGRGRPGPLQQRISIHHQRDHQGSEPHFSLKLLLDLRARLLPNSNKIQRYGGEQLDANTHWPNGVKTKNLLLSRSPICIQRLVGAQLVTLSFPPKFGFANGQKTKLLLAHSSGYPG